jgi:hypothetical protein
MSIFRQQNPKAVDYFALLIGIIAAALEYGLIMLLCLGELGGPIDFRVPLLLVAGFLLAILAIFLKFRIWWHGILSGLFFAVPVAAVCFVFGGQSSSFSVELAKEHGGQLRFVALTVVFLSVSILTIKAWIQSKRVIENEKAA